MPTTKFYYQQRWIWARGVIFINLLNRFITYFTIHLALFIAREHVQIIIIFSVQQAWKQSVRTWRGLESLDLQQRQSKLIQMSDYPSCYQHESNKESAKFCLFSPWLNDAFASDFLRIWLSTTRILSNT